MEISTIIFRSTDQFKSTYQIYDLKFLLNLAEFLNVVMCLISQKPRAFSHILYVGCALNSLLMTEERR